MEDLDFSRCRLPPKAHQRVGVRAILDNPFFYLSDEMGAMKSAQAILAGLFLYERGEIDRIIIVTPSAVRSVWYDPVFGELKKHLWTDVPVDVFEFHASIRRWHTGPEHAAPLRVIVTNYEFVRMDVRLRDILRACTPKTLLVCDESTNLKNGKSLQYKACYRMRQLCGRVLLLSGTPIANNPLDLHSQGNLLSPVILKCPYITYFKALYAIEQPVLTRGGKALLSSRGRVIKKITGWQNLDDLQQRFSPYMLRRLKSDCLDLPPKLDPVTLAARLTTATWRTYTAMRDEMVVLLSSGDYSVAQQAVTKIIRLAQITSGFLGGVEDLHLDDDSPRTEVAITALGQEKLDVLMDWLDTQLNADPAFKVLIGSAHRFEVARTTAALKTRYPQMHVGQIRGGQKAADREAATRLLDPRSTPVHDPVAVIMTNAGSMGLNLTASHTFIRLSRDFSLFQSQQADDRIHRFGQSHAVSYFDIMAEGPNGQATIDRLILQAVKDKREIADLTTSAWVRALTENL